MSGVDQAPPNQRFVFDRVFDEKPFNGDTVLSRFQPPRVSEGEAPQYSETDLETARQLGIEDGLRQGRDEGRRAGTADAIAKAEAQTNAAFAALAEQITALSGRQDEMFAALSHDCERLVHVI